MKATSTTHSHRVPPYTRSLIPYIVIIAAAFATTSCFDDSSELEATPSTDLLRTETVTLAADSTGGSISLRSNCRWMATSASPWLTISKSVGEGTAIIYLQTGTNPWAEERSAIVTITTDGGISRDLTVVQLAATEQLTATYEVITSPATAQTYSIVISSNTAWSIVSAPEWLADITPLEARGNATIAFRILDNTCLESRHGVIVARTSSGERQAEIAITQAAAELPVLDSLTWHGFDRTEALLSCRLLSTTFPVTDIGICYSEAPLPTLDDASVSATSSLKADGSFAVSIRNLRLGTTYHARAYAVSPVGIAYSSDIVFQTYIKPEEGDNWRP